jgi:hypothetical protein
MAARNRRGDVVDDGADHASPFLLLPFIRNSSAYRASMSAVAIRRKIRRAAGMPAIGA